MMKRILSGAAALIFGLIPIASVRGLEPPAAGPNDKGIVEITRRAFPSVVQVEAQNHMRKVATGVVIDRDGHIVTTALISPRDETIAVITHDGKRYEAEFLGFDPVTHLAVVKTRAKGLRPLNFPGRSEKAGPGAWVCVIGISPERAPSVTQGIVSSVSDDRLRLNVWVMPGSSGGPVLDEKGRMMGLLRGIYTEEAPVMFGFRDREQVGSGYVLSRAEAPSSGMALAVPIDIVLSVADQIKKTGRVERGWMGVSIFQEEGGEVVLTDVDGRGPAARAGLKPGDIILKIDGRPLDRAEDMAMEIRRSLPGRELVLNVKRSSGTIEDVNVTLGTFSEDEARRELESRFPRLFPPLQPVREKRDFKIPDMPLLSFEKKRYVGIYLEELNPELSAFFGVREGRGLLVSSLTPGGPAEKAGLRVGDVIVSAAGRRVESIDALIDIIQDAKSGSWIKLDILREKKSLSLEVEVAEEEATGGIRLPDWEEGFAVWRAFADRLQNEAVRWNDEHGQAFREELAKIREDMAKKGSAAAEDIKNRLRRLVRKI
jgi:serine protease Do